MNILELAQSIGQPIDFIAFERGIVLRPRGETWITHGTSHAGGVVVSLDDVVGRYLPVLIRLCLKGTSSTFDVMPHPEGGFVPRVPSFGMTAGLMYDAFALQYRSGALVHHVAGIVRRYEIVRDAFRDVVAMGGATPDRRAIFGSQPEPYYEFDALLGVARRSYDACRYLLWKCFGPEKGTMPRSFERVLPHCERLDPEIRRSLESSWHAWGSRVTAYRDCVHHYVPVDFGISSIVMEEALPGVWAALARIPDNPEARSKLQFKFANDLDALTFGWRAAIEASCVLRLVSAAVERVQCAV